MMSEIELDIKVSEHPLELVKLDMNIITLPFTQPKCLQMTDLVI